MKDAIDYGLIFRRQGARCQDMAKNTDGRLLEWQGDAPAMAAVLRCREQPREPAAKR
jgi:hypothetical protein